MRFATILLLLLLFSINGISQSFDVVSKKVSKCQIEKGIRKKNGRDNYLDIRKELFKTGKLNFTDKSDTLFFLESSDIESASSYGKIWNSIGHIEYIYNRGNFKFNVNEVYTDYTCKLIQSWDTASIKKEEKLNPAGFTPRNIYGTRIIKYISNLQIDCILFKEFFKLERDR